MTRTCRIVGCTTQAAKGRTVCGRHQTRIRRHGDPHFTQWTAADPTDVETLVRSPRPGAGITRLERVLVARGLTTVRHMSAAQIADLLGVTPRTVHRWRASARNAA